MAKGRSLHVGLNKVSTVAYGGWAGLAPTCEADASSMGQVATDRGFLAKVLPTKLATVPNVRSEIMDAAQDLVSGDLFLLTFSGHGFQRPGKKVETWALYDGEMIDAEITGLIKGFELGVRVLVVSESCRSGTIIEPPLLSFWGRIRKFFNFGDQANVLQRRVPKDVIVDLLEQHAEYYSRVELLYRQKNLGPHKANVILLAACQENQDAGIEGPHGLFTNKLLSVWQGGAFVGNYQNFYDAVCAIMPNLAVQKPNFVAHGPNPSAFVNQRPFTI